MWSFSQDDSLVKALVVPIVPEVSTPHGVHLFLTIELQVGFGSDFNFGCITPPSLP